MVVLTSISYIICFYYKILKPFALNPLYNKIFRPFFKDIEKSCIGEHLPKVAWFIAIGLAVAFVVYDSLDEPIRLASGGGLIGFIFLGYVFSV